ncbi:MULTISPECIES: DEAD/DEAH box helicase [unclassified Candidatus Frackibacter]|uniref:DEAD/DEAH box helicase n=1 Tax=unclassified Candidatus Frackibacter TaxID=2648818 RepID=UPI0008B61197|nr:MULTISPECIES: SNF2-related protein [unclassified Candidatus Frackibacter]SEM96107.1 Superfamily II DNA or RNA helicase, SNF2 family [Candidatus Frackibacter sp. WG12]SFM04274.1 Superfamily II DNA or RNA helicase, SNF2 family [Candidatus Frackibacter sp. WG13]
MSYVNALAKQVPNKIFRRGRNYYNENRIFDYNVLPLNNDKYQILAKVEGTRDYQVEIDLALEGSDLYFENECTCPYDWGPVCKHEVAVLYKFLNEDHHLLGLSTPINNNNFTKLEELSKTIQSTEPISLQYHIKGLATKSMVNFKLTLNSNQLTMNELDGIAAYIHVSYAYRDLNTIAPGLSDEDIVNIEYLSNTETSRSQTPGAILFPKSQANFNFLLRLIEESVVYLEETKARLKRGKVLYPNLIIEGNLDKVEVKTKEVDYSVYEGDTHLGKGLKWTVIDSHLHPVKADIIEKIPANIPIPEGKRGDFLFEILPTMQQELNLEVDEELQDYKLVKEQPEIEVEFDYEDNKILCQTQVKIANKIYKSTELLGFDFSDKNYTPNKDQPKTWSVWDTEPIEEFINFLEDYEFHVSPEAFNIKDESDIQRFITEGVEQLSDEWEVSTTTDFEEVKVKPVKLEPIIELEDTEGEIDWFEFRVVYNLGGKSYSREELKKLLRRNNRGEQYLQVGNQYLILEDTIQEEKVDDMLVSAEKQEDGSYRSSHYQLLYYRNLVKEAGINFVGNRVYNELDQDITAENLVKEVEIPLEVQDILRNYQKNGYYWLSFLAKYYFGGILADDMGLGKTLQTLTLLKSLSLEKPALIICPRTLIYNWGEEIKKFFPNLDYLVYYGTPDEREEMRQDFDQYQVLITSYSIISRDYLDLEDISFSYVVLDEAHHIKNRRTKRAKGVKMIKAKNRLALTGTPIENSLEELWSIFDFLMPRYLGSYQEFRRRYLNPINKWQDQQKLNELKERIAPFILRRKKEEVLTELPDKIINIQSVQMTKAQEDTYRLILEEVKANLMETIEERGFNRSQINVLAALTKLRQICDHPQLVLDESDKSLSSGKIDVLLEIVQDAIAGGHKLIVFSQFVQMLKLIKERFEKSSINFEYLDGSTKNRMERVKHFNEDPEVEVFLISLKAGGTGLNLTAADIVIHVDPWWNPMVERQATDRTHRIGQENQVVVYKLITTGTVEEKILKLQKRKQDIFENVIEDNANPMDQINWEDIKELLKYE